MEQILKMTYFEIKRLKPFWLTTFCLMMIIALLQIISQVSELRNGQTQVNPSVLINPINTSIFLGVIAMFLASFWIWLQDWSGADRMISRWLAGPFKRPHLYWAKFLTLIFYFFLMMISIYFMTYLAHGILTIVLRGDYQEIPSLFLAFQTSGLSLFLSPSLGLMGLRILTWISFIPISFLLVLYQRAYSWKASLLYLVTLILSFFIISNLSYWGILPIFTPIDWIQSLFLLFMGAVTLYIGSQLIVNQLHI